MFPVVALVGIVLCAAGGAGAVGLWGWLRTDERGTTSDARLSAWPTAAPGPPSGGGDRLGAGADGQPLTGSAPVESPDLEDGKTGKAARLSVGDSEVQRQAKEQLDREISENAAVLAALRDDTLDVPLGAGGADEQGIGGLGTEGRGSGASGYGSGGGNFGSKGEGGIAAIGGDPIILGALDRSLIDAVIKRNMNQIRYCYQKELTKNPALGGKITVKFVIAKDGTVSSATTKATTMNSSAVEGCINGRFLRFQFPEPKGGGIVIVSYPFMFSPG